jgi:hypothetical protein
MSDPAACVGENLYDVEGQKIGKITDVIFNDRTLQPDWFVVKQGMLMGKHLVPAGEVSRPDNGAARTIVRFISSTSGRWSQVGRYTPFR